MPELINGTKEKNIRAELVEIYTAVSSDYYVFDKPRFITLKTHFEANTSKADTDRNEIRYVQLEFKGFQPITDAAQFDVECVPVRIIYDVEIFAQHVGTRTDASNSDDDYTAYLFQLWNATLNNNEIEVSGTHIVTPMELIEEKTDIQHEIMSVNGYRSVYRITVEVYE